MQPGLMLFSGRIKAMFSTSEKAARRSVSNSRRVTARSVRGGAGLEEGGTEEGWREWRRRAEISASELESNSASLLQILLCSTVDFLLPATSPARRHSFSAHSGATRSPHWGYYTPPSPPKITIVKLAITPYQIGNHSPEGTKLLDTKKATSSHACITTKNASVALYTKNKNVHKMGFKIWLWFWRLNTVEKMLAFELGGIPTRPMCLTIETASVEFCYWH